jgi:hypothetical protein
MKLWTKLIGILGLQIDPMLVAVKTISTPTRPMEITSVINKTYSIPKKEKRKPLIRYVDPKLNLVLYVAPDVDVDVIVKLLEWSMGIDWTRTLAGRQNVPS